MERPLDDKIKQLLRDLGIAINESISGSDEVNRQIQKLRDAGYELYVSLDATIGLNRAGEEPEERSIQVNAGDSAVVRSEREVQFRIDVNDLSLLRSLGIDPTRKVRSLRRTEPIGQTSDDKQ